MSAEQLQFEGFLACLDFPGRRTLAPREIAAALGWTARHVCNWIEAGDLNAIDGRVSGSSRPSYRVPIDEYRDFIIRRFTGPQRREYLARLPKGTLRALRSEIEQLLAA